MQPNDTSARGEEFRNDLRPLARFPASAAVASVGSGNAAARRTLSAAELAPLVKADVEKAKRAARLAKAEPVEVQVVANTPVGWRMLKESAAHTVETANRIVWTVRVPGKGSADLSYRIRVTN